MTEEQDPGSKRFPLLRHWVLFVGLVVAFAQFYFLTMLVQVYTPAPLMVFVAEKH